MTINLEVQTFILKTNMFFLKLPVGSNPPLSSGIYNELVLAEFIMTNLHAQKLLTCTLVKKSDVVGGIVLRRRCLWLGAGSK